MSAFIHQDRSLDLARAMGPVACELLGEPNKDLSSKQELRFGTRGSLSIDLKKGVFFDNEAGDGGGVVDLVIRTRGGDKETALAWLRERKHLPPEEGGKSSRKIVAIYDYLSADADLLFQVVRFQPKDFRQRKPDGAGGWSWKVGGVERVLYRLPQVIEAVAAGRRIYVVEGEKAANSLAALGLDVTCSPGGAGKWRSQYGPVLRGADVVVLPDNDPQAMTPEGTPRWHPDGRPVLPGQDHAADVVKHLHGVAKRVRVVMLPGLPLKGDPYDWIEAGFTVAELTALVDRWPADHPANCDQVLRERKPRPRPSRPDPSKPLIRIVAGELHNAATEGEAAIITAGLSVYQRGNALVRPVVQDVPAARGQMTVSAALHALDGHGLIDALCGCATWERYDARSEDWVRVNAPRNVADLILSRVGLWSVSKVVGVITTPTIRVDGSILSASGYDPATRLYHAADPSIVLSASVMEPTRAIAMKALTLLQELLAEFPFVGDADTGGQFKRGVSRSVALSGLITPVVRGSLAVAPLHAFRANTAGTGKSYLVDIASAISGGRPCPVAAAGADEAETEKRLTGLLLAGFPIASLDNVNGELGGDLLCQAIERPFIRLRPLGRSDIIEIESRATLFATGNALRVLGDMLRRTLVGDLDAGMERPELRPFKGDPVATVMANRGRYVSACLAIVRAYILAGLPGALPPIASFADWSNTVRSALVWLGCADPADSMEAAREDDPELTELREIIAQWKEALPVGQAMTCKQIAEWAERKKPDEHGRPTTDWVWPDLRDMLLRIAGDRGSIDTTRLGKRFRQFEGRLVGRYRIRRDTTAASPVARWKLDDAGKVD